jgi:threonine/homoserine/homoserine lactone efflux protein
VDNLFGVIVGIAVFGFVTSVTPGPNNTYLLSSGMNHGLGKSLSYINGIMIGLTVMFSSIALGVGSLFRAFPLIQEYLKYIGFAYVLFLAYGIVRSTFVHKHEALHAVGFFRSALFQLVNPKAWIVLISFYSSYIPEQADFGTLALALGVFLVATYPGAMIWAAFGEAVAGILQKDNRRPIFNVAAAVLLVISMVPVLFLQ